MPQWPNYLMVICVLLCIFLNHELQLANNTYSFFYIIAKENYVYKIRMKKCKNAAYFLYITVRLEIRLSKLLTSQEHAVLCMSFLLMQTFFNYLPTILRILKHFTKNEEKRCGKSILIIYRNTFIGSK